MAGAGTVASHDQYIEAEVLMTRTRNTLWIGALLVSAFTLGGCAHHPSNAQVGTGVGAVAGGFLGDAMFGTTLGTVGGAAAGALIGNQIGKNNDGHGHGHRRGPRRHR